MWGVELQEAEAEWGSRRDWAGLKYRLPPWVCLRMALKTLFSSVPREQQLKWEWVPGRWTGASVEDQTADDQKGSRWGDTWYMGQKKVPQAVM